ncbi:MAG: restriction endonuclease subunit S [Bacteroidetes bacterium CG18_big_fil_WC_8_21_14_2_50_41_14]|nr:MAG: restriction endonuclease subunit S [Bacteroidetes bacterium CG18_big_fil_WC_8_21_14_2_50_41_14]PJB57376.1 MAG: restriction endonuclease subunit S [Bacteroidetes bacterium CG_4_9_14_3_um_filter_41_19]
MGKVKNVPKLRFPEFEGEWSEKKLGEISIKINSGKTPLGGESVYTKDGILFIRSQNVTNDQLSFENSTYIPEEINATMRNSIVKPHDILLNITGASLGRSCVVPDDFSIGNVNQHVCIIRINKTNEPYFIQPIFTSTKGQNLFISLQTGSGREGLNFQSIRKIKLHFPSLPEQQKIASFLTSVDNKIQQLTRKKTLLEQYKKGVMQKIFSQEIRFKDDEGNEFPKWKEKSLGEVGNTYNGLVGKSKENFGIGKPYIQYKQIFDNSIIDISRFELVEVRENEKQNKVIFGDIFFTVSSETPDEIGMASVLLDKVEELYLNSFCFGFRPISLDFLNPYFAQFLFRNQIFRKEIIKLAQGSTRYNMSKVQLMKLKIDLPCFLEQQKIANFLTSIDKKIESVNTQLINTQAFKKGLLQQMFV